MTGKRGFGEDSVKDADVRVGSVAHNVQEEAL